MSSNCKNCKKIIRDETKPCPFCDAPPLDEEDKARERAVRLNRIYLNVISWIVFLAGTFFFLVNFPTGGLFDNNTIGSIVLLILGATGILSRKFIFKK